MERGNDVFRRLLEAADRGTFAARVSIVVSVLAVVAALDWITGYEYSFAAMYLLPVAAAAWLVNSDFGYGTAVLSALIWFSLNLEVERGSNWPVSLWNVGSRTALFLFVAVLVGTTRSLLDTERQRSRIDELTGALNSRAFYEITARELERMRRYGRSLSVAYLDLDDFKEINDRSGHAAGDEVLRTFARCAIDAVRSIDSVARVGDDEFIIVMPETDSEGAVGAVDRFAKRVLSLDGAPLNFSAGIVTCQESTPITVDELVRKADTLMYTAKHLGKNRYLHAQFRDVTSTLPSRETALASSS